MADAVAYWLEHGLGGRSANTVKMYTTFAKTHVISALGARKLRDLSVEDVDQWLAGRTSQLSTRSLKLIHGILNRSVKGAMRRDKVKRNVVELCDVPEGRAGRDSKALTLAQAVAIIESAEKATSRMQAYVVLSLLTGARTEELRALQWSHVVAFDESRGTWLPVTHAGWEHKEFAVYVWRSVRQKGDTKTAKSRRSLMLPERCLEALRELWQEQEAKSQACTEESFVFRTSTGTPLSAHNVRRAISKIIDRVGLNSAESRSAPSWTRVRRPWTRSSPTP
ncbi:tyrosine-type recombinase/integrase [Sinosporangium siamense]|uniref:Integrase n=1 Tax=Sinosporangium siamense TaxID=1367973 RepID=A0A919RDN8_9ACTN|nr:tyrosine-type recombinase/integrase [Sinosporangium siamense]GII91792.1 hypothetical protein Ssi02_20230 [Sinosporangium siamense]